MSAEKEKFSIKNFLPRSLMGRSFLILILPVVLIQVFTAYIFFDRHWSKVTMRLAFAVAGEISLITKQVENAKSTFDIENIGRYAGDSLDLIIDFQRGEKLGEEHNISSMRVWDSVVAQTLITELEQSLHRPYVLDIDFHEKWIRVYVQLDDGVLNISLPGRRLFSSSGYVFLLWMIGTSLLLLIISMIFMRNQVRPILKLAAAAERFGKGRDIVNFKPTGAREVRQAAEAFLDMHKRIRRQMEQRTTMLAGVSHDLRTPLTRLKLQLEMLKDSPDVRAMKSDIQEMQKMIDGYLEFVRGEGDENAMLVDFSMMIDKVVDSASRQKISVTKNVNVETQILLRPMAFERCLMNLISNAAKYATKIWINAVIVDKKLVIEVSDNGPGIAEEHYEDVFKPFYRVDSSRNPQTGGIGLGLPIAMDIVHAHGGKIWLGKSEEGGLKVSISIPL